MKRSNWVGSIALALRRTLGLAAALSLALVSVANAATKVGQEAAVPFKDAYNWNAAINYQPANGEIVTMNPPKFGWHYGKVMPWPKDTDVMYEFQLQISTNSDFRDFILNIRTPFNFYNYLAPFPTAIPIYWRIGHITLSTGETNFVHTPRSFTVAPDAETWDRSMLASDTYLESKAQHPYILLNNATKADLYRFLTNAGAKVVDTSMTNWVRGIGWEWRTTKYYADQAATNAWVSNHVSTNLLVSFTARAQLLGNLAFLWQLTGSSYYTNNNPMEQLYWTAQHFIDRGLWKTDPVADQDTFALEDIALAYDMFYPALTDRQREKVRQAIGMYCNYTYHGAYRNGTWRPPNNPEAWQTAAASSAEYSGGYSPNTGSPQHIGTSHWHDQHYTAFRAALATFSEERWARLSFDFGLNYLVNRGTPFGDHAGVNQGRTYGMGGFGSVINAYTRSSMIVPEANLRKSPILANNAKFWDYYIPVGFKPGNEPWGDGDFAADSNFAYLRVEWGRTLACISGSPTAWQHWLSAIGPFVSSDSFGELNRQATYKHITVPFYFPPPAAPQPNTTTAALFPADGWGFASSEPPNTPAGYTNGVGIVFQARPRGCEEGHSHNSDLSYQIWAYGANITDAGGAYGAPIAKVPEGHYTLLVNGYGPVQGYFHHYEPWAAKFIGFTNANDFVYFAAEAVNAYPRKPGFAVWNNFLVEPYRSQVQINPPLAHLQSVQRHIVMPRKKYFVMLDTFQAAEPSRFTWLYHVLEPTLSLDPASKRFTYTATNQYHGTDVNVHVAHIASPSAITITNMTGADVYKNPITGVKYEGGRFSRSNVIWVSNANLSTNWHFMTVIYPEKWGSTPPTITRLDDFTVEVKNGTETDIVSFDPQTTFAANIIVDLPTVSGKALQKRPEPPQNLRVVAQP